MEGHFTRRDESADFAAQVIATVTDFVPLGVLLVHSDGTVLSANRAAREMAREQDGIGITGEQLVVAGQSEGRHLRRVVADSVGDGPEIEICNVSRPSGKRPYRMLVVGIEAGTGNGGTRKLACIFLSDDEHNFCPEETWLESFFGLTRTEAKLASLLAGGATLEQITADMGICMPTARTHLSRILDKTGASRQAELIRIILRSPTLLLRPNGAAVERSGMSKT